MVTMRKKTLDKIKQVRIQRYQQKPPTFDDMPKEKTPREKLQARLQGNYFVVAGGAWQHLWDKKKVTQMGFGAADSQVDELPTQNDLRSSIRPELLKRFRNEIVIMPAMTTRDYETAINEFAPNLPSKYRTSFRKAAKAGIPKAVAQKLGMRFFEEVLSKTLTSPPITEVTEENTYPDPF